MHQGHDSAWFGDELRERQDRDRTALIGSGALQLLLDRPGEQQRELAGRLVQIGNDCRRCGTANGWFGQALAARILGLQEAWNHPPFFAHVDRHVQVEHSEVWHRTWVGWHAKPWDAWRSRC